MIKLMDLLLEAKLSPKEQEQFSDALAILKDDTLDEGIMDKLKKLGLSATVIAALLATPQLSQAQKEPLKDLAKQTAIATQATKTNPNFWVKDTSDIKKVQNLMQAYRWWTLGKWKKDEAYIISDVKYSKLSDKEKKDIENKYMKAVPETKEDGKNGQFTSQFIFPDAFLKDLSTGNIENLGIEGNNALQIVNKVGLTPNEMKEWNNFVGWMKSKGESGNSKMNNQEHRDNVLQQYKSK